MLRTKFNLCVSSNTFIQYWKSIRAQQPEREIGAASRYKKWFINIITPSTTDDINHNTENFLCNAEKKRGWDTFKDIWVFFWFFTFGAIYSLYKAFPEIHIFRCGYNYLALRWYPLLVWFNSFVCMIGFQAEYTDAYRMRFILHYLHVPTTHTVWSENIAQFL